LSTIPRVADSMCHILTVAANEAAKRSSFVKRRRKLDGASFVQALVFGWMANPEATAEATAEERAQVAASRGVPISAYDGLDKRCDERGADCLRRVLTAAVGQAVACAEPAAVPILGRFEGVYVYDGSVVSLPEELREEWPGLGANRPGAGVAALKIGVRLELLGGELYAGPCSGRDASTTGRCPWEPRRCPRAPCGWRTWASSTSSSSGSWTRKAATG
jgi:hypothetical protein